jgi:TM2 domain-containing membrane protein YozV
MSVHHPQIRTAVPLAAMKAMRAQAEYDDVKKTPAVAYALWCVVGILGGHRFYLGDTGRSIAMLFTLGGLGVWTLVDVFFIAPRVRAVNRARRAAVYAKHQVPHAYRAGG